ncbi:hypothetical protein BGZ94_001420 [Podila epigama]|nr:hypothetical protein BGZ94_001420 [Podila epigama]
MDGHDLTLDLVLGRSLSDGIPKHEDPVPSILHAQSRRTLTTKSTTQSSKKPTTTFRGMRTINSAAKHSYEQGTRIDSTEYRSPCGYGLDDYSSDDSDEHSEQSEDDNSNNTIKNISTSRSTLAPLQRQSNPTKEKNAARPIDPNSPVDYVAHITGRMDPWEVQVQKLREEGKELAPLVAKKIVNDFHGLAKTSHSHPPSSIRWVRDNEDILQHMKSLAIETENIKEKRKQETQLKNQKLSKEIDECLARIKDERETAIRIREEALKQQQEEKERAAKEAEERKKAAAAEKEAKEKKAKEESEAAAAAASAKAKKAAEDAAKKAAIANSNAAEIFVSATAAKEYENYKSVLDYIHNTVEPAIQGNKAVKKQCAEAKRDIIPLIGQLINVRDEVIRVAIEIDMVFKKVQSAHGDFGYYWIMNITAKKFVQQAGNDLLVKVAPAFPMAHVIVLLFTNHPKFLEVLMARFSKKCPYVMPMYIAKDDVCGDAYLRAYGKQAMKTFKLMYNEFIPMVPKEGVAGATRLKTQLEDLMKQGKVPVAEGRNFT